MRGSYLIIIVMAVSLFFGVNSAFADPHTIETADNDLATPGCFETEVGCYTPNMITVDVGHIITMTNTDDTGLHTFTAGTVDGFVPTPSDVFDSGILNAGDSFEYSADTVGEFPYYCTLHVWMTGVLIVQEAAAEEEMMMEEETVMEEDEPEGLTVTVEGEEIPVVGKTITIHVTGANQTVEIQIIAEDGEIIDILTSIASSQGEINLPWIIPNELEPGIYTVIATDSFDSDCIRFDLDTFAVDNNCVPEPQEETMMEEGIACEGEDCVEECNADPNCTVTWIPPPEISPISPVTINEDESTQISLVIDNPSGNDFRVKEATGPLHGSIVLTTNSVTYTPDADYVGTDEFSVYAQLSSVEEFMAPINPLTCSCTIATISIEMLPVNDTPTAGNDVQTTTDEDSLVSFTLTGFDVDGDSLTYTVVTNPTNGALSGTAPNLSYLPDSSFSYLST